MLGFPVWVDRRGWPVAQACVPFHLMLPLLGLLSTAPALPHPPRPRLPQGPPAGAKDGRGERRGARPRKHCGRSHQAAGGAAEGGGGGTHGGRRGGGGRGWVRGEELLGGWGRLPRALAVAERDGVGALLRCRGGVPAGGCARQPPARLPCCTATPAGCRGSHHAPICTLPLPTQAWCSPMLLSLPARYT